MDQEQYAELMRLTRKRKAAEDAHCNHMDNLFIVNSQRAANLTDQLLHEREFASKKYDIIMSMCVVIRYPYSESRWRIDPVVADDWIEALTTRDVEFKIYQRPLGQLIADVRAWPLKACKLIFDSADPYYNGRLGSDGI